MASNPYVNKVQLANGTTLIDLTSDTVEAGKMLSGYTAHDKSGAQVTGSIATKSSSDLQIMGLMMVAPAGYYSQDGTKTLTAVSLSSGDELSVVNGGDLEVTTWRQGSSVEITSYSEEHPRLVIVNGEWYTSTPTASGTYYGKVVVSTANLMQEVYPVGSLWATYDGTKLPGTELGFGTWTKVSPINPTWRRLKQSTTYAEMAIDSPVIYVWKRTG